MMQPKCHAEVGDPRAEAARAHARLLAAMQVGSNPVPPRARGLLYNDDHLAIAADAFWFESPGGVQFHYRNGEAVTAMQAHDGLRDEFELYLWGTVFGAVAWYQGLVPLHASAVAHDGRIIAFTADSGGGKSTLAAGLAAQGFDHVCDDTLVLAPTADVPFGLPDGKPLKLWDDAFALLDVTRQAPIASLPGKHHARVRHSTAQPLPLTDLVFLERGEGPELTPITGAAKLELLPDAFYRGFVHTLRASPAAHACIMLDIATRVRFWRLVRPWNRDGFAAESRAIGDLLRATGP